MEILEHVCTLHLLLPGLKLRILLHGIIEEKSGLLDDKEILAHSFE